ncbi:myomegalin-like isoform 1 protein [Lasius niger]|uniref:Myomegalin-like isoform 1 protein n=1 Tax=Lasius niger TaxID=67767 RepID=A0A0J7K010_LASNI|nr:myomegalin-like isoform 1 protein [Lasius niger]
MQKNGDITKTDVDTIRSSVDDVKSSLHDIRVFNNNFNSIYDEAILNMINYKLTNIEHYYEHVSKQIDMFEWKNFKELMGKDKLLATKKYIKIGNKLDRASALFKVLPSKETIKKIQVYLSDFKSVAAKILKDMVTGPPGSATTTVSDKPASVNGSEIESKLALYEEMIVYLMYFFGKVDEHEIFERLKSELEQSQRISNHLKRFASDESKLETVLTAALGERPIVDLTSPIQGQELEESRQRLLEEVSKLIPQVIDPKHFDLKEFNTKSSRLLLDNYFVLRKHHTSAAARILINDEDDDDDDDGHDDGVRFDPDQDDNETLKTSNARLRSRNKVLLKKLRDQKSKMNLETYHRYEVVYNRLVQLKNQDESKINHDVLGWIVAQIEDNKICRSEKLKITKEREEMHTCKGKLTAYESRIEDYETRLEKMKSNLNTLAQKLDDLQRPNPLTPNIVTNEIMTLNELKTLFQHIFTYYFQLKFQIKQSSGKILNLPNYDTILTLKDRLMTYSSNTLIYIFYLYILNDINVLNDIQPTIFTQEPIPPYLDRVLKQTESYIDHLFVNRHGISDDRSKPKHPIKGETSSSAKTDPTADARSKRKHSDEDDTSSSSTRNDVVDDNRKRIRDGESETPSSSSENAMED